MTDAGTPVWASTFAPFLRTFIHENPDVKGKKIAVFTCFSGGGADKAIDKMKKYIGIETFETAPGKCASLVAGK